MMARIYEMPSACPMFLRIALSNNNGRVIEKIVIVIAETKNPRRSQRIWFRNTLFFAVIDLMMVINNAPAIYISNIIIYISFNVPGEMCRRLFRYVSSYMIQLVVIVMNASIRPGREVIDTAIIFFLVLPPGNICIT